MTACCAPRKLEWLVMPQGSKATPGSFVEVINDDVIVFDEVVVFDAGRTDHVRTIPEFSESLRKYNLKLSPSKARLGATKANFRGQTMSPAEFSNPDKVTTLASMPMPKTRKQLRSLLGGVSYYRKVLQIMARRLRPITSLLKQRRRVLLA